MQWGGVTDMSGHVTIRREQVWHHCIPEALVIWAHLYPIFFSYDTTNHPAYVCSLSQHLILLKTEMWDLAVKWANEPTGVFVKCHALGSLCSLSLFSFISYEYTTVHNVLISVSVRIINLHYFLSFPPRLDFIVIETVFAINCSDSFLTKLPMCSQEKN